MLNNKLPDTDDVEKLRAERQAYYDEAQNNRVAYTNMKADRDNIKADRDNIRQQLEDERDKKVREKYENLKQDYRLLEGDLKRAQGDLRAAQDTAFRRQQQMQQEIDQLRREVANFSNEKKNLAWQLQAAKEREQQLMQIDQSREREIKRWKDLADRLRQGGAGAPAAPAEFADPEPGDPPDYEREKEKHNHRKVIPENGGAFQLAEGWRLIGASRRGRGHELKHTYRDDDFAVQVFGNGRAVAVAIADGLGSKPLSRWGARAAANGAVLKLEERGVLQLAGMVTKLGEQRRPSSSSSDAQRQYDDEMHNMMTARDNVAKQLIEQMLLGARDMVKQKADKESKSVDELHSTLLVFLAIPHKMPHNEQFMFFASAQVGDGAIRSLSRAATSGQWTMQEQPQLNGIDNEVQPFMRFDPSRYRDRDFIHVTDLESPEFIVGMTDGTLDDIEGGPDENGLFKGIEDFYGRIRQDAMASRTPAEGLYQFLGYRKRASFDDRTLVCLYRGSGS